MTEAGKWSVNLNYQATQQLKVGVNYRPFTNDVSVIANWRVLSEAGQWRPSLILGTSNDDFDELRSQAYFGTLSKHLLKVGEIDISAYGGAVYIDKLEEFRGVGGIHFRKDAWSGGFMHNGVEEHISISRDFGNHTVTFLLFNLELPGIAYGFRF